jgi:dsRNA-specific ribonuclease
VISPVFWLLQIDAFMKEMCKYPVHSNGLLDPPKVVSDIVESLIGAIYLDSNFNQEEVWRVYISLELGNLTHCILF